MIPSRSLIVKSLLLCGVSLLVALAALSLGSVPIAPEKFLSVLAGNRSGIEYQIIINMRLPRLLLALVIGGSLSVSGVIFQAVLKNPLADPYTVGVSAGAALGATIAIVLSLGNFYVTLFALVGSLVTIGLVYALCVRRVVAGQTLVLAGIALSFIFTSAVLLIFSLASAEQVHKAMFWLMGDLSLARYGLLGKAGVFCAVLVGAAIWYAKHLDVISFGDEFSRSLGIRERDIGTLFLIASFLSALSVSLCGTIGFVGLIMPHLVRRAIGPDHRRLVVFSAAAGAIFLAAADTLGRTVAAPYEIPAGIITGFAGGLFFLFMLLSQGRSA